MTAYYIIVLLFFNLIVNAAHAIEERKDGAVQDERHVGEDGRPEIACDPPEDGHRGPECDEQRELDAEMRGEPEQ